MLGTKFPTSAVPVVESPVVNGLMSIPSLSRRAFRRQIVQVAPQPMTENREEALRLADEVVGSDPEDRALFLLGAGYAPELKPEFLEHLSLAPELFCATQNLHFLSAAEQRQVAGRLTHFTRRLRELRGLRGMQENQ